MDKQTQTELEAAAFRRLLAHLDQHKEAQNIDLMILAGFCRNCLSKWLKAEADQRGTELSLEQAQEWVYGMPYSKWKASQPKATAEQLAAYEARQAERSKG